MSLGYPYTLDQVEFKNLRLVKLALKKQESL